MVSSAEKRSGVHNADLFGWALADAAHAGLAVPALEREFLADAVAAVDLHRGVDHASEDLARIELGNGGLDPRVLAAVGLPRALPGQPARRAQLDLGVRQHPLDRLALGERGSERGALLGVRDGHAVRRHAHPPAPPPRTEALPHHK